MKGQDDLGEEEVHRALQSQAGDSDRVDWILVCETDEVKKEMEVVVKR